MPAPPLLVVEVPELAVPVAVPALDVPLAEELDCVPVPVAAGVVLEVVELELELELDLELVLELVVLPVELVGVEVVQLEEASWAIVVAP